MSAGFELELQPGDKVVFEGDLKKKDTVAELKITNPTDKDKAYKVKCTDNSLFKIIPPVALLKAGENDTIKLKTKSMEKIPTKNHYFAIFYMDTEKDAQNARKAWEGYKGPEHRKTIQVEFKDQGEKDKEEEKDKEKEGEKDKEKEGEKDKEKKEGEKDKKKEEKDKEKKEEKKEEKDKKKEGEKDKKKEEK